MNTGDAAKLFVSDASGPEGYLSFFQVTDGSEEDTPSGGYFYVSDRKDEKIIKHLEIYKDPKLEVKEEDVRIFWSSDGSKCGIAVWGRMRGVVNIANGEGIAVLIENRESPAISDPEWLKGFEKYLDQNQFIRARQRFWKEMVKQDNRDIQLKPENETPVETNFLVYDKGPDDLFAVFEDEGTTGYLYLYDSREHRIVEHVHDYDRSERLTVAPEDVEVVWSEDGKKCGVIVCGKMRGIIDRQKSQPGRVWMENRDAPGIADQEWLKGFEYLRS